MERKWLADLVAWKGSRGRKPLILRGVRQVGKTYLLQHFGRTSFPRFHYFNFEENSELKALFERNLAPERILTELQLFSQNPLDQKTDLVIFDEIQECPRALTSLKYFHEKIPELAVCAAGSLLGVHLNAGSFPVGKVELIDLYPLSFFEFLAALGEHDALDCLVNWTRTQEIPLTLHQRLWERLKWYFVVGGLPEAVVTFVEHREQPLIAFEQVRKKQEQLIIAYLADVAKHSGKVNAMHIERLLRAIPHQLAKTQDGMAKRFQFKGVIPKVDKYSRLASAVDWLETAHMMIKIPIANRAELPLSAFTKESWFKLFLFDVGVLGAMSGLPPKAILDYDYGSYKGYFAENFVAQELLCSGQKSLCAWEEERSEIEFLIEKEAQVIPVEVKSGWITKAKSLAKFQKKYAPQRSIILSANECSEKGSVLHLPLYLTGKIGSL